MDKEFGQQSERVEYNQALKDQQIDMNPPAGQEVEPLTGSSVLVEPKVNSRVPDNGFPAGYGPNENLKRVEKPKKPSLKERMKRSVHKLTKKQKIRIAIITGALVTVVAGIVIFVTVSGVFKVDYSETYTVAKELRTDMQSLRSNASCDKVLDYVDNAYTTMQIYQSYVESCKEVGAGVTGDIVTALGDTEGILRDENLQKKYETFKLALEAAKEGNSDVNDILDLYSLWHGWVIAESEGDSQHSWEWTESDVDSAAKILAKSNNKIFQDYGEKWAELKKAAAAATYDYYHSALDSTESLKDRYAKMNEAQDAFTEFKKEHEPDITKELPLSMVDTAKLYDRFTNLYDAIREAYQNNYNSAVGGCKEMIGQVVCD